MPSVIRNKDDTWFRIDSYIGRIKKGKYGEQIFEGLITMTIKMTRDNNKYIDM